MQIVFYIFSVCAYSLSIHFKKEPIAIVINPLRCQHPLESKRCILSQGIRSNLVCIFPAAVAERIARPNSDISQCNVLRIVLVQLMK